LWLVFRPIWREPALSRALHWTAGGIDVFLISTAITPNKIIAGVVLIVVVLAAAGFWMSRRRRG
jgi:hypothetical protein